MSDYRIKLHVVPAYAFMAALRAYGDRMFALERVANEARHLLPKLKPLTSEWVPLSRALRALDKGK